MRLLVETRRVHNPPMRPLYIKRLKPIGKVGAVNRPTVRRQKYATALLHFVTA